MRKYLAATWLFVILLVGLACWGLQHQKQQRQEAKVRAMVREFFKGNQ